MVKLKKLLNLMIMNIWTGTGVFAHCIGLFLFGAVDGNVNTQPLNLHVFCH